MVPGHVAQVRRGCGHAGELQSRPSEPLPCGKLSLGKKRLVPWGEQNQEGNNTIA